MPNVYFYKMHLIEQQITRGQYDAMNEIKRSKVDLENYYKRILATHDENGCIEINEAPDWVVLEVLKFDKIVNFNATIPESCTINECDYVFGRIGRKKDITNVQKRNRNTFKPVEIPRDDEEDLEIHTYFYLFFEHSIIVYLGAQAAPGIHKLDELFNKYYKHINLKTEIQPVTAEDIVEILKHKDIVNSFEVTLSLPCDEILNIDNLGLDGETFDMLRDSRKTKIVVDITAEGRNDHLFKEKRYISKLIERLQGINKVKKLRFKAKNDKERTHEYDIIEKRFTKNVQFKYKTDEGGERRKEIEAKLFSLYIENKADIIRYCRD